MLLAEVVATASAVAATRSRLAKVDALAGLLARLEPDEILATVGFLTASPRQGRLGVGWRSMTDLSVAHPDSPSLAIADVDAAFEELARTAGAGSGARRTRVLAALAERATTEEWDFIVRVMLGELRTGALEGVLLDAIARAAERDPAVVRRAAMLSGDLGETARVALTEPPAALGDVGLVVGRPVLPMLASTAATVADAVSATGVVCGIQARRCPDPGAPPRRRGARLHTQPRRRHRSRARDRRGGPVAAGHRPHPRRRDALPR